MTLMMSTTVKVYHHGNEEAPPMMEKINVGVAAVPVQVDGEATAEVTEIVATRGRRPVLPHTRGAAEEVKDMMGQ